jgi:sulfate adenylyltransferase subunit 1
MYEKVKPFPVQTVIRPKTEEYHDFRGYAGKLYGIISKWRCGNGTASLTESVVTYSFDKQFEEAAVGLRLPLN